VTSALYECEVVHQRLWPKRHGFRYRIFFLDLFLDELPWLDAELGAFAHNRWSLYSFFDRDHLPLGKQTLRENLDLWLQQQGSSLEPTDRVRFISLPRVLGYVFNPASFYFVYSASGEVKHCLVQVTNTFHEIKAWSVNATADPNYFQVIKPKEFYVSPYSELNTEFDYQIQVPGDEMHIKIDTLHQGRKSLMSWISGKREPLTTGRLLSYLVRYPFMTLAVILRIHWHALRLWSKRLPFQRKADHPELQRGLYRPHSSLTQSLP
jgi:uncharacterized protein